MAIDSADYPFRHKLPCAFGEYQLKSLLGTGGMAYVYAADRVTGGVRFPVALKVPKYERLEDGGGEESLKECRALVGLNSEHILRVSGVGEVRGIPYVEMEHLVGVTLDRLVGKLSLPEAWQILLDMARGLAVLHEKGLVHRDIKPSNVFVTTDGRAKLMDLGIAKDIAASSSTRSVKGTPRYMAPEQRLAASSVRSDVFSWAAVAWECFSGNPLFDGQTESDVDIQRITVDARVRELRIADMRAEEDDSSGAFFSLLAHCLNSDERKRPASGAALAEAMEDFEAPPARKSLRGKVGLAMGAGGGAGAGGAAGGSAGAGGAAGAGARPSPRSTPVPDEVPARTVGMPGGEAGRGAAAAEGVSPRALGRKGPGGEASPAAPEPPQAEQERPVEPTRQMGDAGMRDGGRATAQPRSWLGPAVGVGALALLGVGLLAVAGGGWWYFSAPEPASLRIEGEPVVTVHTMDALPLPKVTVLDKDGQALQKQPTDDIRWTAFPGPVATLLLARVVPVGNGEATVEAKLGDIHASYRLVVALPDKIEVAGYTAGSPWPVGQSARLTATVLAGADIVDGQTVTWSSSDAQIASVDASGEVTGMAEGAATITATSGPLTATIQVTVGSDSRPVKEPLSRIEAGLAGSAPPPSTSTAIDTTPGVGLLDIGSTPRARVVLDGVFVRYTPVFQYTVRAGAHTVDLVTEDGRRKMFMVDVAAGGEYREVWSFEEDRSVK